MADARLTFALAVAVAAGGCAAGAPPEGPARVPPRPARVAPSPPSFVDAAWGLLVDGRALVEVPLPERVAWRAGHRDGWAVARHEATSTTLGVRAWRAEGVVSRAGCEDEARRTTRVPDLPLDAAASERILRTPPGYDTALRLAVLDDGTGHRGVLLVFGANVRRCLALYAETTASGPGALGAIVARLELLAAGVARGLAPRTVEDRVRRPPPTVGQ